MGRRKGQIAMMSRSLLVKDKQRGRGPKRDGDDTFLHTTELDDGTTYNRINFQSVTEQSNLEDFLTTAEMAGKDFTAERQNIQIISSPGQGLRLTDDDYRKISDAQHTHKALLQIPRRPAWDENTTKEELIMMERDSFTDWRRQLKMLEEKDHIQLTPYEKNLDFWRQLWRVIERSDVVVQIVDARNPLLFRCEDLETYVKQVDPRKTVMLLINKADFLNKQQREQWVEYFNGQGITAVFFSAKVEKEKQEGISNLSATTSDNDTHISEEEEESEEDAEEVNSDDENEKDKASDPSSSKNSTLDSPTTTSNISPDDTNVTPSGEIDSATTAINSLSVTEKNDNNNSEALTESSLRVDNSLSEKENATSDTCANTSSVTSTSSTTSPLKNNSKIVTADELLDIFRKLAEPASSARPDGVKTVGMVGYPNVGKSSTINVILEQKKLAVSATPGRTKHLQTLFVDQHLMLCDCPGLVFPSFVATKAHLVINGILPIDELRDHISPTCLICDQIPRSVLEATYSIMIPRPSLDDDPNRIPTAEELLNAYGGMRGFMTPRGVPDGPRASRYILKDYVKGKLLYCEPPPGISGPEFQDKERITRVEQSKPVSKVAPAQIKSDIDKEFFVKKQSKANSKGKMGVSDFVRVDTLQATSRMPDGLSSEAGSLMDSQSSVMGSQSSIAAGGKSWKKHNNKNKKEKLRRLHRDLDV